MVSADCDSLIDYLVTNDLEKTNHQNEMMKCINTLMFVINHMYNELKNKLYYNNTKTEEDLHQNNNCSDKTVNTTSRFEGLKEPGKRNDKFFNNDRRDDRQNDRRDFHGGGGGGGGRGGGRGGGDKPFFKKRQNNI